MIQEAYCSKEVSILLKEKGFDENTSMVYMSYGDLCKCNRYDSIRNSNYNDITKNYFECTAPTHQMAMAWLRENKGVYIEIRRSVNTFLFGAIIEKFGEKNFHQIPCNLDSYEQAVEEALKYSLENLI